MTDCVKETLCTRCVHKDVCIHKLDYLNILEAIKDTSVVKDTPDGRAMSKKVSDYDFIDKNSISCRYYRNWTDVYRDYENND